MIKLSNKYLAAILIICIIASAYLLFSSYRDVGKTYTQAKLIIDQQQTKHRLVDNMHMAARERSVILLTMLATDDIFQLDELHQEMSVYSADFMASADKIMTMDLNDEERVVLNRQISLALVNGPLQNQAATLFMEGKTDEAEKLLFEMAIPKQQVVLDMLAEVLSFYEKNSAKVVADIDASYAKASKNFQILAAALLALIASLIFYAVRVYRQEEQRLIRTADSMSYQATHDPLTGLINRWEFESCLVRLLKRSDKDTPYCVCYLDLDQFKIVNDTCGHHVGDDLLRQITVQMKTCLQGNGILARIGGDEFGIILKSCDADSAKVFADSIIKTMSDFRFYHGKYTFRVGVSIGIAQLDTASELTDILKQIDSACYAAKDAGGSRYHFYTESDQNLILRKFEMDWVNHIEDALENNRFILFAQPIVATDENDSLINYELLIRMNTADNELILAGTFLPAAERYNKMIDIDRWVVNEALRQLSNQPQFIEQIDYCSINLSSQSLIDEKFLKFMIEQFEQHKNLAEKICLEITETVAIANLLQANHCISTLKNMGIRFALDDFGSGLASFEYLKNLPIDYLKIDGMFVKDIVADPIDRAMVKSIHEIGSVMGKITIAEFVENEEILEELKSIGVHFAQGFLLGHPMPLEKVILEQLKNTTTA